MLWSPLAHTLGQADPGPAGWAVAAGAAVVLLLVDAAWKAGRRHVSGPARQRTPARRFVAPPASPRVAR